MHEYAHEEVALQSKYPLLDDALLLASNIFKKKLYFQRRISLSKSHPKIIK